MKKTSKRILLLISTVLMIGVIVLLLPFPSAQAGTQTFFVPDETKPTPISASFTNGSFETPSSSVMYISDAEVPGWGTIPVSSSDYSNTYAYFFQLMVAGSWEGSGPQFCELNAAVPSRIYQSFSTTPGSRINWSFMHRAMPGSGYPDLSLYPDIPAYGNDVMNFYLRGAGSLPTVAPLSSELIQTASENCWNSWSTYKGVYTVPSGQTQTEANFASISWWAHNDNGNFLDDVVFKTESKLIAKKTISTSAADDSTALQGETVAISVTITNWGETDASRCVFRDILSDGLDYVAGSATINGASAGSLATFNNTTDELRINFGTGATAGTSNTNGGILEGSLNTVTALDVGEGMSTTISFQAVVTGNAGNVVKNQASITYNDKDYEGYHASDFTCYSSVAGRTVNSGDETSYVNRFTIISNAVRSISGRVWDDADADGTIDTTETRGSGVTVGIYNSTDTVYTTPVNDLNGNPLRTTTSSTGTYSFTNIPYGVYKVVFSPPGWMETTVRANDNDAVGESNDAYAVVSNVEMTTTTTRTNIDFGYLNHVLAGVTFWDADGDGSLDSEDAYASGITVGVYNQSDTTYTSPVANKYGQSMIMTVTDKYFGFHAIPPGTYKLVVTIPSGFLVSDIGTSNKAVAAGTKAIISNIIVTNEEYRNYNNGFGFTGRTLAGRAWIDIDADGSIDTGETLQSGLSVSVYSSTDTSYTTPEKDLFGNTMTLTTGSSGFIFFYLPSGTYKLAATTPNMHYVTVLANDNDAVAVGTRAVTTNINLAGITHSVNNDLGFVPIRTLSGRAWMDTDADGAIDASEAPLSGLTVGIYASTDTTYTTPVTNIYGASLTTTTSATGTYSFASVPYGTYKVVVTTPGGYIVTTLANDNDAVSSGTRALINNIALTTVTSVSNMDFGFTNDRTISGTVWTDIDWDGMLETGEPRVSGLTVGVYPSTSTTYTTPVNDLYGTPLTTTTDANGAYSFTQIPYGTYKVVALTPDNHIVTLKTASTDNDALAESANAVISGIDLTTATAVNNRDIGFAVIRSVNGRVWADTNWNGMIDATESRLSGMTVGLYAAGDTAYTTPINGIYGSPLIAATNAAGEYNLNGIPQGSYQIVMTTPDGLQVTLKTASTDNDATETGTRAIVSGVTLTGATASVDNMDFGYGVLLSVSKNARLNAGSISNGTPTAPVEAAVNDKITYSIDLDWNDAYALANIGTVDITDVLPAGLTLVKDSGTYTPGMTWSTDTATGITTVFWEDATVTSEQHQFAFQVTIESVTEGALETFYVNSANVTAGTNSLLTNETYHRVGTKSITISKIVKGNLADPKEDFNFRIVLNDAGASLAYTGASTIAGVEAPADGTILSGFAIIPLKHGQSITIDKVPVGSSYVISEILIFSGYQLEITETNGGSFTAVGNAGAGSTILGDVNLLFTNTLIGTVPTGILLQIYPYALMAILAGGVLTLSLSLARRKKQSRQQNAKRI